MTSIRLVNKVSSSRSRSAEFRLSQGDNQVARIGVHAGACASIPTSNIYIVQATTVMGNFTLTSNVLQFNASSTTVLAQVLMEKGYYDFQLTQLAGTQPSTILCENTCRVPVQFKLTQPGSPIQIVTVVDEHNNTAISTVKEWQCYAIVNGITTASVAVSNPSLAVTLTGNNNDDGFALSVS